MRARTMLTCSGIVVGTLGILIQVQGALSSHPLKGGVSLSTSAIPGVSVVSLAFNITAHQVLQATQETSDIMTTTTVQTSTGELSPPRRLDNSGSTFGSDFWSNVISNMIGALVGAMLAIPTGLWIDRQNKAREQQERTKMVLQSIYDELSRNQRALEDFLTKQQSKEEIDYPPLSNDAWQAAQSLDVLSEKEDYELRKRLIGIYERIEFITQISQSLWNMFFTASVDFGTLTAKVKPLTRILREETEHLIPSVAEVLREVQNHLRR